MGTERKVNLLADNQGNERKQIDKLRAVEGMEEGAGPTGLASVGSGETGSPKVIFSRPTRATDLYVTQIHAYNSVGSGTNTYSLYDVEMNDNGSITSATKRSVPVEVNSANTSTYKYTGAQFDGHVAVESEFQGEFGVAVISDHHESDEPSEGL